MPGRQNNASIVPLAFQGSMLSSATRIMDPAMKLCSFRQLLGNGCDADPHCRTLTHIDTCGATVALLPTKWPINTKVNPSLLHLFLRRLSDFSSRLYGLIVDASECYSRQTGPATSESKRNG